MKLEEIKKGQTVWHPCFGQGRIVKIFEGHPDLAPQFRVCVDFHPYVRWFDHDTISDSISHLYPHPVTVIATEEVEAYKALADSYTEVWKECLQGKLILYHELVKAQGELIDLLESGYLSNQRARDLRDLKVKINQLQSKTEK